MPINKDKLNCIIRMPRPAVWTPIAIARSVRDKDGKAMFTGTTPVND